jgi:3-isopropylmalate dehydrogenase
MMLRYSFDRGEDAKLVERAVENALARGLRTADIVQDGTTKVSTGEMGDALLEELGKLAG